MTAQRLKFVLGQETGSLPERWGGKGKNCKTAWTDPQTLKLLEAMADSNPHDCVWLVFL